MCRMYRPSRDDWYGPEAFPLPSLDETVVARGGGLCGGGSPGSSWEYRRRYGGVETSVFDARVIQTRGARLNSQGKRVIIWVL